MEKYIEGFRQLFLNNATPVNYPGPHQFATHFQRASVLAEVPVRYSSHSVNLSKTSSTHVGSNEQK